MKKLLLIGALFGAGIFLSLGFISSGGGGGDALNARHADNVDNSVGTNGVWSGFFTGVIGFQNNLNPLAITPYNGTVVCSALYGDGNPFVTTTPGGGYSTLTTPDGFDLTIGNLTALAAGVDPLIKNNYQTTDGAQLSTYTDERALFYNAGKTGGVSLGTGFNPNDPCLFGEPGEGLPAGGEPFHIGNNTGGDIDFSVSGTSGIQFNGDYFIRPDSDSNGGTTIGIKASDDGTQMYLHVTSAGVLTITTTP